MRRWRVPDPRELWICISKPRDGLPPARYHWSLICARHDRSYEGMIHHIVAQPIQYTKDKPPRKVVLPTQYHTYDLGTRGCSPEMMALIGLGKIKNEEAIRPTLRTVPVPQSTAPTETWVEWALASLVRDDTILDPENKAITMIWPQIKMKVLEFAALVNKDDSPRTGSSDRARSAPNRCHTILPAWKMTEAMRLPPVPRRGQHPSAKETLEKEKNKNNMWSSKRTTR